MSRARTTVFIHRRYDDPELPAARPWPRLRKTSPAEPDWHAVSDPGREKGVENATFDRVDHAIAWARERSERIIIALGNGEEAYYSAGDVRLTEYTDGSGDPYLQWPPDNWPDYRGPDAESRRF